MSTTEINLPQAELAEAPTGAGRNESRAEAKRTAQIIWDTILALREAGQAISRKRIMELTGLRYSQVDDHISRWIDVEGRLRRVVSGVYELVEPMPEPRATSVTDLHNGMVLIECGDQEMRLYTHEARSIARQLGGFAQQISQLQIQHDMGALLVEATVRNRALADRVNDLERAERMRMQGATA